MRPAQASASAKVPAVIVIHENRGLNPYIEDVARRLGTANFMALAPDGLTSVGGYPGDDEKGGRRSFQSGGPRQDDGGLRRAAATWLKARPESTGKLGAVGFCFGGAISNTFAVRMPDLAAAVPFYGFAATMPQMFRRSKLPCSFITARWTRIWPATWPAYDAALKAAGVVTKATFIRAHSTGSTTTRRHATTRPRQTRLAADARLVQQASAFVNA